MCWSVMAAVPQDSEGMSRRHGIRIVPVSNCSVESCALAIGEVVGHDSIVSASRMNGAVVMFLDSVDKVNHVVEHGVVIEDAFTSVMPLMQPARRIIVSNVPPFIKDDLLIKELSRHGKIMSQMKKIPLGCKSPLLKHVVCFRRQIFMILNNGVDDLNMTLKFRVDGFDYVVFVSSDSIKCFECGGGHMKRVCPLRTNSDAPHANEEVQTNDTNADVNVIEQVTVEERNDTDNVPEEAGGVSASGSADGVEESNVRIEAELLVTEEDMNTDIEKHEAFFKTPVTKRKRFKKSLKKVSSDVEDDDSKINEFENSTQEESDSEAVAPDACRGQQTLYTFEKLRNFLQKTKNMKNVQVVNYFPDRKAFIDSVVMLMRGKGEEDFTVQEMYRLKKFVSRMKMELRNEDGFETT